MAKKNKISQLFIIIFDIEYFWTCNYLNNHLHSSLDSLLWILVDDWNHAMIHSHIVSIYRTRVSVPGSLWITVSSLSDFWAFSRHLFLHSSSFSRLPQTWAWKKRTNDVESTCHNMRFFEKQADNYNINHFLPVLMLLQHFLSFAFVLL